MTISGNYLIGSGFSFEVAAPIANNTISNVSVNNNDIGFNWYGQYIPGTTNYATVTGITVVDFSNPTRLDQRPRGLCGGWRSNDQCGPRRRGRRR